MKRIELLLCYTSFYTSAIVKGRNSEDVPVTDKGKDPRITTSVQRALDILSLFDAQTPELSITEIAKVLNLHKSTIFRFSPHLAAQWIFRPN